MIITITICLLQRWVSFKFKVSYLDMLRVLPHNSRQRCIRVRRLWRTGIHKWTLCESLQVYRRFRRCLIFECRVTLEWPNGALWLVLLIGYWCLEPLSCLLRSESGKSLLKQVDLCGFDLVIFVENIESLARHFSLTEWIEVGSLALNQISFVPCLMLRITKCKSLIILNLKLIGESFDNLLRLLQVCRWRRRREADTQVSKRMVFILRVRHDFTLVRLMLLRSYIYIYLFKTFLLIIF